MQSSISIELRRSRLLDGLLVSLHAAAIYVAVTLPIPIVLRIPLIGLVILSAWRSHKRPFFSHLLLTDAGISLREGDNASAMIKARVLPETTVSRFLVVLRLRAADRDSCIFHVVLLPDQMRFDEFRWIRIWLRWRLTNDAENCV